MKRAAPAFLLAALVPLLLYARATTFDFVRADDEDLIAGNQAFLSDLRNVPRAFERSYFEVEGESSGEKTYYRPVTIVSFMLDATRAGASPGAYHTTNVVLHAATVCLLLALALKWGAALPAALAAALVFAVHPVNVQAVAWIAGRNDLLVAVFGLVSLIAWTARSATALAVAIHTMAFALALFAKEIALFFPVLAVLHQRIVLRRQLTRGQWIALGCDAAIVAVWIGLRAHALGGFASELTRGTPRVALVNAPQLLVHTGKMLVPMRLNVSPGIEPTDLLLGAAAVPLLAALLGSAAARRWLSGGIAVLAAAWALLFLLPTLAVPGLPVYEHRAYVPLLGVLLALASTRRRIVSVAIVVMVVFATVTYQRQEVFRNAFTYWTDGTRDATFGPIAHVNVGQLLEDAGRPGDARREYLRALERDPNTPKAHNDLGVVLMALGESDLARDHFEQETRRHPSNAEAWFNLGLWNEKHGHVDEARRHYARALAANRHFRPAREKLAMPPAR